MSKALIGSIVAVGAVAVIAGVIFVTTQNKPASTNTDTAASSQQSNKEVALVDPEGTYKLFSDPSITKHPEAGFVVGGGEPFSVDYDGSKSAGSTDAILSYQLYYIQDDGKVINFTGGTLQGQGGKGTFTADGKVFTSAADGRKGFVEVTVTYGVTFDAAAKKYNGTTTKLGMYSVKFKVSE